MEVMINALKGRVSSDLDDLVNQTDSSFNAPVNSFPLPSKFRMPHMDSYDGVKDSLDHLETFKILMHLQDPDAPSRSGRRNYVQGLSYNLKGRGKDLVQPANTQLHQHLQGAKRSIYYTLHWRTSV